MARGLSPTPLPLALAVLGLTVADPVQAAPDPDFARWWQDGKAELDGYRWQGTRYGEPRTGEAVMIFVTEPWSESKRVKVEDTSRTPGDVFEALKLNLIRDFQTGIYDYNTMVSVFVRSADFTPVKISFSSAEWCGHVFDEIEFKQGKLLEDRRSYFEDESATRTLGVPEDGVTEDALFILLRGLRGEYLKPGAKRKVSLLSGVLRSRLTHRPLDWTLAEIERLSSEETVKVPAGRFRAITYVVRTPGREGRFMIEAAYPHRVLRWSWTTPAEGPGHSSELTEMGELTGSDRLAYWKLNGNGNERYREAIGLAPRGR